MDSAPPDFAAFRSLRFSAGGHPVTRLVSQRAGALLAYAAWRLGLAPNQVTVLACLASVAGALLFAEPGGVAAVVAALLLMQLGYALDCADGQLARATGRTSRRGHWLDVYLDMLTIASLAFAALYRVQQQAPELGGIAMLAAALYCFARVSNLMTCTIARAAPARGAGARKSAARLALLTLIDTPVVILCICLLAGAPLALVAYLGAIAVPFIIHGLYVGLSATRPEASA